MLVGGIRSFVDVEEYVVADFATFVTLYTLHVTVPRAMPLLKTAITMVTQFHHLMSLEYAGFQKGRASGNFMPNRTTTCSAGPFLASTWAGVSAAV